MILPTANAPDARSADAGDCLLKERRGAALYLTLNRPGRLNALSDRLVDELYATFAAMSDNSEVRVIVLAGAGRAFCAGFDVQDSDSAPGGQNAGEVLANQRRISRIVAVMRSCPQPIICLLNGAAAGGGFALALASDIRIGTPAARMNAAFIRLGLSGCDIGVSYFLPRLIGSSRAAYYLYTGAFMNAEQGLACGLLLDVVQADALSARGDQIVEEMLYASPLGLRLTKDTFNASIDAPSLAAVLAMEDRTQSLAALGPDFAEGIQAFRERRKPEFRA